jgi:hypothetical protein
MRILRRQELFEQISKTETPDALAQAVEFLFAAPVKPQVLAISLQVVINDVTLTPAQWERVVQGAAAAENNALKDVAARRARETAAQAAPVSVAAPQPPTSTEPAPAPKKPWWRFW